jgi:hypothetical protein
MSQMNPGRRSRRLMTGRTKRDPETREQEGDI